MVERNFAGCSVSLRSFFARRLPDSSSFVIFASFTEITAISAQANTAFRKISMPWRRSCPHKELIMVIFPPWNRAGLPFYLPATERTPVIREHASERVPAEEKHQVKSRRNCKKACRHPMGARSNALHVRVSQAACVGVMRDRLQSAPSPSSIVTISSVSK